LEEEEEVLRLRELELDDLAREEMATVEWEKEL